MNSEQFNKTIQRQNVGLIALSVLVVAADIGMVSLGVSGFRHASAHVTKPEVRQVEPTPGKTPQKTCPLPGQHPV